MPSTLNASLLFAVLLAALLLRAPAAPVEDALTDSPAGDPASGEEEEVVVVGGGPDRLSESQVWGMILSATKRHEKEFEDEFHLTYLSLDNYKFSSLPAGCPPSNFSKEACLHRLAQGLLVYTVLLKHVEKEYPGNTICSDFRQNSGRLIDLIKEKMKNREQVTELTSIQEAKLLKDLEHPDTFHRKMTAHNILRKLHDFLRDGKKAIAKRETRGRVAPITFYQMLKK